ncbi:MAG: hypothetical protein A2X18_02800 [Bacteroidetes bacterium GWF2_40_14]|nr:MAG: hypothetical protein A2X18_02800 [Bacteroidetes bacterium GWF2_40_14]
MKTNIYILSIITLSILLILGCKKEVPKVLPTLTTATLTNITSTTASGGGSITNDGGAAISARGVCWSTNQNPTINDNITTDGAGIGSFISSITGLTPGTTYYVRAYATNSVGTAYGDQVISTTIATLPTLTTTAVTAITDATASSGGHITFDGGSSVTARGVCWSTSQSPTINDNKTINGMGSSSFISSISGLSPGTTYYIRAYATNSMGTGYGNQLSATTLAVAPTITTLTVSPTTETSATGGGNITSDGGSPVTSRGICWSTNQTPTILNNRILNGTGTGSFTSVLTGLTTNTVYYVRSFATNAIGTSYGSEASVVLYLNVPGPNVTDVDGNLYHSVKIGAQIWTVENLKTTKYRNGELIGTTTPSTLNISVENTPKYQWAYAGNESNVATFGRLYTWYAATDSRSICPSGWHLPTDIEWTILTTYLGGESVAGGKLKEIGTTHWLSPNTGATNTSGFTALPDGFRYYEGSFNYFELYGNWWCSTEASSGSAFRRDIYYDRSNVGRTYDRKSDGYSVRCIKD